MSFDLPLDNMTLADKLEAMEVLWADISRKPADLRRLIGTRKFWMNDGALSLKGS